MKARQVLLFILGVFLLLGAAWYVFPAEGIRVGTHRLRFASREKAFKDRMQTELDLDSLLNAVEGRFAMHDDTLAFYKDYFFDNPDRIFLPDSDYTFFDPVFKAFEQAQGSGKTVRVVHYGDSQIEMDRISSNLREALQTRFGGSGTGMFPALTSTPMATVSRTARGNLISYKMIADSTSRYASHHRYGPLAQVVGLNGSATVILHAQRESTTPEHVKRFSSISLLYGRESEDFSVEVSSDTLMPEARIDTLGGATWATWYFGRPVNRARLTFVGNAELYGISTDGAAGVTVDNVPMRGSTGTILTRIDTTLMKAAFELDGTALIILQFGGNFVPAASSSKAISGYMDQVRGQIAWFRNVAPAARILFIGPSDMAVSTEEGNIVSYRHLPELVDSLKTVSLQSGAAYWDLYRMMGGKNSMSQWVRHGYAGPDHIHFTKYGANIVGEAFSRSLLTCYDFYDLRKTLPADAVKHSFGR